MSGQQTPYTPGVDPLEALLRRSALNDRQRAGLWDLYEASTNPDDLSARLQSIEIPNEIKSSLWVLKNQETSAVPAQTQAQAPEGSAGGRFVSNAWEMVNPVNIAKGLYHTATSPIETGKAIVGQSANQWGKAGEMWDQGRYLEAVGHGAGAIPVVGPIAAEAGEQIASGDVAGGLGKAFGILAPFGAAEGVARLGVKAAPAAVADKLEAGAASRYADVMSPKSSAAKGQRMAAKADKIAPELAKDTTNAAWSRQGLLDKFEAKLAEKAAKLDEAADARNAGAPVDTKPILDALRAKRAELTAEPFDATRKMQVYEEGTPRSTANFRTPTLTRSSLADTPTPKPVTKVSQPLGESTVPGPNQGRVAVLDQAIREIEALGPVAPYESLRRVRAAYDGPAEVRYNPAVTPDFLANQAKATASADVAGAIRDVLANADPVTAAANAEYSLARSARDITKAAQELERARPRTGRQIMAKLTGSIIGGAEGGAAGAVTGYAVGPVIDQLMSSGFTTKLQTAKMMQELATAIRTGNVERATTLSFKIRQLAKQGEAVRARGSADQVAMQQPAQ